MNELKKIIIINKSAYKSKKKHFVGYLVKDMKTKFIALNESKKLTFHFPKISYKYESTNVEKTKVIPEK